MRAIIEQVAFFFHWPYKKIETHPTQDHNHHHRGQHHRHNHHRGLRHQAEKVAERSLPLDAEHLRRLASDVSAMTDALCELRAGGRGVTPQVNIGLSLLRDFEIYHVGGEPCEEHPEPAG